ncbi:glycosyltransferase family 4 protein [Pontibacter sp. CAU 1760]
MPKLKIAFVSYEYTPDIGKGGIATYIGQIATAMSHLGHHVEIFSGSSTRSCSETYNDILTHRVLCSNPREFQFNVVEKFKERNRLVKFDVFECAEINADGALINSSLPHLPLIIKLHTPTYLIIKLLNFYTPVLKKIRFFLGNFKRGIWRPWGKPDLSRDEDYKFTAKADLILSPSISLKKIIVNDWAIPHNKIKVVPNPYKPSETTLSIPINRKYKKGINILFIGKLNIHKGIINLAKAIPGVIKAHYEANFIFIGSDGPSPLEGITMESYLKVKLQRFENIKFVGTINLDEVPGYLADADICVFPSVWENFPYVCLEAMSSGAAVIGSDKGGMQEMLSEDAGVLIDPLDYKQIEAAIKFLIQHPEKRKCLGAAARAKVLKEYNLDKIGKAMEQVYLEAMENKKKENRAIKF